MALSDRKIHNQTAEYASGGANSSATGVAALGEKADQGWHNLVL